MKLRITEFLILLPQSSELENEARLSIASYVIREQTRAPRMPGRPPQPLLFVSVLETGSYYGVQAGLKPTV